MAQIVSIDSQTRRGCVAIINAKCALIVALHRSAARPRLTRINKTKIATAKRKVSAQRFRKQLLISLPLSRPVARLIMNAPRRRAASDQATRISHSSCFHHGANWDGRRIHRTEWFKSRATGVQEYWSARCSALWRLTIAYVR